MEKKFELTKEILKKILEAKEENFTLDEIEQLMNSEVEKPEEEMDTELVDMCASILAKAYNPDFQDEKPAEMFRPWENNAEPKKKRVIRLKYVFLVAAALVILFTVALPAGAKLFDSDASDSIIEFYEDFFKINLGGNEATPAVASEDDLVNEMILNCLNMYMLPEALLSDEYQKTARLSQDDYMTTVYIELAQTSADINGHIMITQYKDKNVATVYGNGNVSDMHRNFKQITICEVEVLVFGDTNESFISYITNNTSYDITLNCDFDTMVSIAETIKEKG